MAVERAEVDMAREMGEAEVEAEGEAVSEN